MAGRFFLTLKNIYSGIFAQYANFGWSPSEADPAPADRPVVDRWMLSRLATVEREIDERLERYDATAAARALMDFVVDDVSNWYVRLNRARFYDVDSGGQPSGLRDAARGARRGHAAAGAVRAVRERLDPPRAHGHLRAPRTISSVAGYE